MNEQTKNAFSYYGWTGQMLRVNLSQKICTRESIPDEAKEMNFGGRGLGAYLLLNELAAGTDSLGPNNKLIFASGPLTGTLTPGASRAVLSFRSPLSETYSYSLCGGHFPVELKFAGYDVVIVEGRSDNPVYLWIDDDMVEIRDASQLWGLTTHKTEDALHHELKDTQIHVACIGPAGEKLVRFACIQSDYHREFGRGGGGAVMGSKNLKAIAVRGTGSVKVADPDTLKALVEETYKDLAANPKAQIRRKLGTPEMVNSTNKFGYWGTRNFSTGYFEKANEINGESFKDNFYERSFSCFGCPVACGKVSRIRSGSHQGTTIEGPEFETIGLIGANCGISDPRTIIKATELCDIYGIDTMTAGATISLAMECYEKGFLTEADTEGKDLSFGNDDALLALVEQIVKREGIGDILAEGSKRAAEHFGDPELAMQVKGMEFATYEPRGSKGMGLSYAVSTKGGHHMFAPTMGAETSGDGSQRFLTTGKAALVQKIQTEMAIVDSLVLCASMRFAMGLNEQMDFYKAVTGVSLSPEKALEIGERIVTMERLFNIREGFTAKDDTLPPRIMQELMPSGASSGQKVELAPMLNDYYEIMGWDREGKPTLQQLKRLRLSEFEQHQ